MLVAHFTTTDEKISAAKLAGVGFGFAGTVVLVGPAAFQLRTGGAEGELAVLLAAFIYASGALYGRRFQDVPPIQTATGQITAALVILLPLSLLVDRPWTLPMPGLESWAALFGIALLGTALAYVLFYRLLAIATATVVSLVAFLVPVHALWLGTLFLRRDRHAAILGRHGADRPGPGGDRRASGCMAHPAKPRRRVNDPVTMTARLEWFQITKG